MNFRRLELSRRVRLSLWRWTSIAVLAVIGAVVFEVALPIGWRFIKPFPEPTRWFSGWFVYVGMSCALLALAFVVVEPIRFRTQHLRRLHQYPALWFAILFAVAVTAIVDVQAPPLHHGIVPPWSRIDVLLPLALVAVLASALRQRPWRWSSHEKRPVPDNTISWDALKQWFQREEPLQDGPDLLGHGPIAAQIHNAIVEPRNQGIALIGPIGSGKSSILNAVKRKLRDTKSPFVIVAEFNCWAMPRPEDAPRIALERAIEALATTIDVQAVRRLPMSYQRVLSAEPTGKISKLLGLDDVPDAAEQLKALSPLLEVLDARLLLIIEDAERAGRAFETRPLERLLWILRQVERVSFVLSFDVEGAAFDYLKVCDVVERIPRISVSRVEEVLAPAYEQWRAMGQGYVDPLREPRKDRLGLDNVTDRCFGP